MFLSLFVGVAIAAQSVTLKTDDGKSLSASLESSKGAKKGVVLLHMNGRTGQDYGQFATRLAKSGASSIAPDLRGHGKSLAAAPDLSEADYLAMTNDVRASVAYLRKRGATEISCVGASIGANLCLLAAEEDPAIENVVLLSAGLNFKGLKTMDAMKSYGDRPLLMVASEDDSYSARTMTVLEEQAKGQFHTELYARAGHGTKMMNREAALEGMVISWVLGTYKLASGDVVTPKVAVSADGAEIETTGEKLSSHK